MQFAIFHLIILVKLLLSGVVLGLLHRLVEQVPGLVSRLSDCTVDGALVLPEQGQDHVGVDDLGPVALEGRHAPHQEDDLAQPVEGDPASDEV